MKRPDARAFRPSSVNQERLEFAGKIGLNVSELINEVLEKHLQEHLRKKADEIQKALATQKN